MAGKLLKDANGLLYARILRVLARTTGVHSAFLGGAFVDSYLSELYGHQEWADAEHWHAFESHPPVLEDKAIRERLLHIHLVQHAFLWLLGARNTPFEVKKIEDFASIAGLKKYGREGLAEMNALVKSLDLQQVDVIEVPWFKPPAKITIRHALMQAAMHSHYHRGQNATRLRELGGVPPTTDFIIWLHKGQPAATWG
jgi:uncharacterized damage-inducible protein DinB